MELPNPVDIENAVNELTPKVEGLVEKANQVCSRLKDRAAAVSKATHRAIRENPYKVIGIAFVAGLLLAGLVTRCSPFRALRPSRSTD